MPENPTSSEIPTTAEAHDGAEAAVDLIAAALRGEPVDPARLKNREKIDAFLSVVAEHGVGPLLHRALKSAGADHTWPTEIREALTDLERRETSRESVRVEESRRVLAGLDAGGVAPLVIKGTALAYSLYTRPHLRPRDGIDLLVRQAAVVNAVRILGELGYQRHDPGPGQRVLRQDTYQSQSGSKDPHILNLHWGISSRAPQADNVDYADLRRRAVALDALSPCAHGLCHEDALLHACLLHANESDKEKLIRLYDIHLLIESMTAVEFSRFAATALEKRAGIAAQEAVEGAMARFHTALPSGSLEEHFSATELAEEALRARGISPTRHRLNKLFADLRACYGASSPAWQPTLYLRRGFEGVASLLRRSH